MNPGQLLEHVIRPTLDYLGAGGESAERLILGTAAVESGFSEIVQVGGGPARGVFQCEPATENDIHQNFLAYRPHLNDLVDRLIVLGTPEMDNLTGNLFYATAMCRVHYLRVPEALPDTVDGMAEYHKQYYNTHKGKSTPEKFKQAWIYHGLENLF